MGCLFKLVLTVLALLGFSSLEWLSILPGNSIFWIAFLVILAMAVIDFLLWGIRVLITVIALPLSFLTVGFFGWVVEGVFKYISLYLASLWIGMFSVPWILSSHWWQAIIIGVVFAIISYICTSNTSSSHSNSTYSR